MSQHELDQGAAPRVVLAAPDIAELLLEPVRALGVVVHAAPHALDVTPPETSKAAALESIRMMLDVAPKHTIFVGDGMNDLLAMAWAAESYAMGHAPSDVRAAADHVTGTLAEHGAALVLRNLLEAPVTSGVAR